MCSLRLMFTVIIFRAIWRPLQRQAIVSLKRTIGVVLSLCMIEVAMFIWLTMWSVWTLLFGRLRRTKFNGSNNQHRIAITTFDIKRIKKNISRNTTTSSTFIGKKKGITQIHNTISKWLILWNIILFGHLFVIIINAARWDYFSYTLSDWLIIFETDELRLRTYVSNSVVRRKLKFTFLLKII